jgi:hypothetical protein
LLSIQEGLEEQPAQENGQKQFHIMRLKSMKSNRFNQFVIAGEKPSKKNFNREPISQSGKIFFSFNEIDLPIPTSIVSNHRNLDIIELLIKHAKAMVLYM